MPMKLYTIPRMMFLNLILGKCSTVNCITRIITSKGANPIAVPFRVWRR